MAARKITEASQRDTLNVAVVDEKTKPAVTATVTQGDYHLSFTSCHDHVYDDMLASEGENEQPFRF